MNENKIDKFDLELHPTKDIQDDHVNGSLTVIWRDWDEIIKNPINMIYVSSVNSGESKGPHIHTKRNSHFVCIHGKVVFIIKEKDDVKKSIKDIEKAIETGKLTDASQKTEHIIEKLETKITRKRILKFAPTNWNELEKLDKTTELYEYYINEKWDLDGIKDDLKILKQRKNEKEDIGIELIGIPDVWKELSTLDKQAKESDYRVGNSWDISGIRDDLALLKNRNQKLAIFEDKKQKKKVFTKTIEKKENEVKIFKKDKKSEYNSAYIETDSKNTKLDDLKYLKELYDEGLIDSEEFKTMKKEVLGK